jgi:hypothetical protein
MLHLIPRSEVSNGTGSRSQSFSVPPPLVSSGSFIYTGPPNGTGSQGGGMGRLYANQNTLVDEVDDDTIVQRHYMEYLGMINYTNSRCGPLTITLRKLLNLPSGLQRTLNVKLQRGEQPRYMDYTKLLELKNLNATSLSVLTLRKFARIAPLACRIVPLERELSSTLSSKAIAEPLHRDEFDVVEHNIEWSILRLRISIVEADAHDDDHYSTRRHNTTSSSSGASGSSASASRDGKGNEGQVNNGVDEPNEGGLPILTVKDHSIRTNGLSGKASYIRHGHAHVAWKQAAVLKAKVGCLNTIATF